MEIPAVGCVPFVNAYPLVEGLVCAGENSPLRILFDQPSQLPNLLESGAVEAILVSSFDALTVPNRSIVPNVCIASDGEVMSVRLFSKVPFHEIGTLALDQSSLTSNALAQILLKKLYGIEPKRMTLAPNLETMLSSSDACVLIGDLGMEANGEGLHVLDLGLGWKELTGLPFVWAAWTCSGALSPTISFALQNAYLQPDVFCPQLAGRSTTQRIADWVLATEPRVSVSGETLQRYFESAMKYELTEACLAGLDAYRNLIEELNIAPETYMPQMAQGNTLLGTAVM